MNYARTENNTVAQILRVNPATIFAPGFAALFTSCPEGVQEGWLWDGDTFTAPPDPAPTIPQVVSRAQFILALLQLDLLDEVEAAIEQADRTTQINYKERLEFERSYPLIATMAAVLGKTDAEVDALFVLAATL